jgi:hypothetical protein
MSSFISKNVLSILDAASIQGIEVAATVPTSGQVLAFDGTDWAPTSKTVKVANLAALGSLDTTDFLDGTLLGFGWIFIMNEIEVL